MQGSHPHLYHNSAEHIDLPMLASQASNAAALRSLKSLQLARLVSGDLANQVSRTIGQVQ